MPQLWGSVCVIKSLPRETHHAACHSSGECLCSHKSLPRETHHAACCSSGECLYAANNPSPGRRIMRHATALAANRKLRDLLYKGLMKNLSQCMGRLFGVTGNCAACSKLIPAFEMVMRAKDNVYHLDCFACQLCNQRFCVGDKFFLKNNMILCQTDYEEGLMKEGYAAQVR
uniref:LIM domain only protein 3 n=1 Tax=Leptobrachium leishanense TaxID=445787 RepID=A0A8C5PKE8_9ANUR